jgi:hypothetical protein
MIFNKDHDPQTIMNRTGRDLRAVGAVFLGLGLLEVSLILIAGTNLRDPMAQVAVASGAVMLVGPGVWYLIAASRMKHQEYTLIRPCIWIAMVQSVSAIGIIAAAIVLGSRAVGTLLVAAALTMFFVPAVFACIAAMRRAERLTHLFIPEGKAFHLMDVRPRETPTSDPPP